MHIWNEYLIDKNILNIKNLLIKSKNKADIAYINSVLDIYKQIEDAKETVTEERYIKEYYKLVNPANIEEEDIEEKNMFDTVYQVSCFLENFNKEYYDYFNKMFKNGLIFLDKNSSYSKKTHYIDPINKMGFIHIKSNFENDESISLIEEFARVFQSFKNEKQFDDSKIAFKNSFPLYLKYSFINYLDLKTKDEIVNEIKEENEDLFSKIKDYPSKLEKDNISRKIVSNYFAMFMFLNNDIEPTFDSIDEFLYKNHNDTKARELWSIANKNIEGIDHIKDRDLGKNRKI